MSNTMSFTGYPDGAKDMSALFAAYGFDVIDQEIGGWPLAGDWIC